MIPERLDMVAWTVWKTTSNQDTDTACVCVKPCAGDLNTARQIGRTWSIGVIRQNFRWELVVNSLARTRRHCLSSNVTTGLRNLRVAHPWGSSAGSTAGPLLVTIIGQALPSPIAQRVHKKSTLRVSHSIRQASRHPRKSPPASTG